MLNQSILPFLQSLPLYERLQALADAAGERIGPALYATQGDAGAVNQLAILKPQADRGPYIIHDMRAAPTGTASAVSLTIKANGINYCDNVRVECLPTSLNAPIVVEATNQAVFGFSAGAGAHGTIRLLTAGFHCSDHFAKIVRNLGELFARPIAYATTDSPKALKMERETLLEAIVLAADVTNTEIRIRAHDVELTPAGILGSGASTGLFSRFRGFGRAAQASGSGAADGLTGRCQLLLPREASIVFRIAGNAATMNFGVLGRTRWIDGQ